MPGRLLLPKNELGTPDYEIGKWKNFTLDFHQLETKLEKPDTYDETITSIPSPWARMLLFRDALSPAHKLHNKLMSELLDILEIIFFKNSILYSFNINQVDLGSPKESSQFLKTISDLNPSLLEFRETKLYYLIEAENDKPLLLAASSPYTLFFSPEDKDDRFKRYFKKDRKFEERPEYFRKYVKKMAEIVNVKTASGNNNLTGLNDFLSSVVGSVIDTHITLIKAVEDKKVEARIDILDCCKAYTQEAGVSVYNYNYDHVESALKLKSSKTPNTPPLVLKNNYKGIYFNNYLFPEELKDLSEFKDRSVLPGEMIKYPWIFPERDFLEERIIKVPYDTNDEILFTGKPSEAESRRTIRYLLPLKPKFFEYFNVVDVDELVTIEEKIAGEVEVKLSIPVVGNEINRVTITKIYFGADQVIETTYDEVPYLAIWPKIAPEHWEDRYFMLEFLPTNRVRIEFYDKEGELLLPQSPSKEGGRIIKQNKIQESYEYNIYNLNPLTQIIRVIISKNDNTYNGLFLIDEDNFDKISQDNSKEAIVSVDFGTSNTTIGYQIKGVSQTTEIFEQKNDNNGSLNYSDFVYFFTMPKMNTQINLFLNSLKYSFFPQYFTYGSEEKKNSAMVPFSSIISYQTGVHENQVMIKANIPFYLSWASDEFKLLGDLKWQTNDQARELTNLYLEEILLMVKSFLIKKGINKNNVTIVWSYPRSFSSKQITQLQVAWKNFLKNNPYKVLEVDESKASLLYFINEKDLILYRESLKVCIDIGGGTSDISAHKGNENILFSSTLIGGNDLIGESDSDSPFLKFLLIKAGKDTGSTYFFENEFYESAVYKQIESLKIKFNYIVKKELKDKKLADLLSGADFNFGRFILIYFFSIILYEIGLKFRKVIPDHSEIRYPERIFIGGNGSKFLNWLNYGSWTEKNDSLEIFNKIFKKAVKIETDNQFIITLSNKPKSEIAIGACHAVDDKTIVEDRTTDGSQYLCENISVKDENYNWDTPLSKLNPDPENPIDFTKIKLMGSKNSNLIEFNELFFDVVQKSNLIDFNQDPLIKASYPHIKKDLLDTLTIEQYLRTNAQQLFTRTQDLKISLFILGAKGCLNHLMKIIRKNMTL